MRCRMLAAAAVAGLALCATARAEIVEEIAAKVNGEVITKSEVEERDQEIRQAIFGRLSGAELDRALAEYPRTMLVEMINEKLLYQRAERLGLDLEQVYRSALDNIKRQNNIQSNDELVKLVQQQGMTMEEFRRMLLKFNVPDIMLNLEVRRKIVVREEEVEAYYQEHIGEFAHPATYTFREIAILLPDHERADADAIARQILVQAAEGVPFETLVERHSEAPSRDQGGLVESLPAPEMSAAILDALVKLEPEEVSPPVETSRALMILQLVSRTEPYQDPVAEIRGKIEVRIQQERYKGEEEQYLRGLWEDADIEVKPKYESRYPTDRYRP